MIAAVLAVALAASLCPIERASYRLGEGMLRFSPSADAATVSNAFTLQLSGFTLVGVVQFAEDVGRPYGTLFHDCPEGDVTGEEIRACTVWEGVPYGIGADGAVAPLGPEGSPAPQRLLLPDLGPALALFPPFKGRLPLLAADAAELDGCSALP